MSDLVPCFTRIRRLLALPPSKRTNFLRIHRRALAAGLPMVARWGRWEGADRERRPLEIDIIASLADGRTMTGAGVHYTHLAMLQRAADAGRAWAHAALEPDAPLLYVAAGGFTAGFREAVATSGHPATCWDLGDVYAVS